MDEDRVVNVCAAAVLAALSVFDYPERQAEHEKLRAECISSIASGDSIAMEGACRKGCELLPDDPVWAYNLACALSKNGKKSEALDSLERAVRLGFRDSIAISSDADLKSVADDPRFEEIIDDAERLFSKPVLTGPMASVPAHGVAGMPVVLGAHNLSWNLDAGCFEAKLSLAPGAGGGNEGDLYFNRDGGHSTISALDFPGLTPVALDREGREKSADLDFPNIAFGNPVFGNCSRALVAGEMWRSLPRALMTVESRRLALMHRFYMSNQIWVFPAVYDCPPAGTNGDVFASATPYWVTTAGKSWSDRPYLSAALEISRSLKPETKKSVVSRGLLAPLVQTVLRKSLKGVASEEDYLSPKAHPTAMPQGGLDSARLKKLAASFDPATVPPVATLRGVAGPAAVSGFPEITYATPCAMAIVLRAPEPKRIFGIAASGGDEMAFVQLHGRPGAAKITKTAPGAARVEIDKSLIDTTNRVDVGVFAKAAGGTWGPPSFVSFAVVDPSAPYSDPALTPPPEAKKE